VGHDKIHGSAKPRDGIAIVDPECASDN